MFFFEITKENPELAQFEIERLLNIELIQISDSIYLSQERSLDNSLFHRLSYTRKIFLLHSKKENLDDFDFNSLIKNTYKLNFVNLCDNSYNSSKVFDIVYHKLNDPLVDMNSPKNIYSIFYINNLFYFTEQIFLNIDTPSQRRAHLRIYNHPTSLNPKQAKAMINLVSKKSFLDPFCGSGGILIEGCLMGLDVYGSDISEKMLEYSKHNLFKYNLDAKLSLQDATTLNKMVECIVTDLPFGKNSEISENLSDLILKFLKNAENITNIICLGYLSSFDLNSILRKTNWKVKKTFEIYVHKSMNRSITLITLLD